jgi:hypothetical protein
MIARLCLALPGSALLGFTLRAFAVLGLAVLSASLPASGALAQVKVKTQTIRQPNAPIPGNQFAAPGADVTGTITPPQLTPDGLEIMTNPARLPPPVLQSRERILAAMRSGDLQKLQAVMDKSGTKPVFAYASQPDPVAFWKANYPDSDGVEILSILATILETGFLHVDDGKPQEMYLWPYFARMPLRALTPAQKVDLFRVVTGSDYKDMLSLGSYAFYRLGIAPDGTWRYFVLGE